MRKRRTFSREFKLSILRELNLKSTAKVCREHNLHQSVIQKWKKEYNLSPEKAFSGGGNVCKHEAEIAMYQRLLGKMFADMEFLKKTNNRMQELIVEEKNMRSLK